MRILICDDEERYILPLRECIEQFMAEHDIPAEIISGTDPLLISSSEKTFDIAFLDIQMDGIDGLTFAKELRRKNSKIALFFITNYDNYQDNAMDLQALRYFSKPFDEDRLLSGLEKAIEYIDGAYVDVFLYSAGIQKRILVDEVIYLTLERRKVFVQTTKNHYLVSGKLDDWVDQFPHTFFGRVHKSYLINLHHVQQYTYSELVMSNGSRIPIAPKKQAEFRRKWFEYVGRR